jgi:SAM-dependent methyltransferase
MPTDTQATADFYGTRQGARAALLLRQRLLTLWPSLEGQSVLGLGYATPYLRLWRDQAARCIALTPAPVAVMRWPPGGANLSCIAEEDALPFPDLSFDRILLVHGLEVAENSRRLLREIWRVLKDDGRLLVVAPNRRGLWAHVENTPFGQGQPYSPGQIGRLLAASMFRVLRRDTALYMPPLRLRLVLRAAQLWEKGGRRLLPHLAGLTITEAEKDMYGAVPSGAVRRRRRVRADPAWIPALGGSRHHSRTNRHT